VNYAALVAAVSSTLETTFNTADMDRFIQQCETRVYNSVLFPSLRRTATSTLTINDPYFAAPTDFLAVFSYAVIAPVTGEYTFLLDKDTNFIREAYPSPTATGTPKHYALFGPTVSGGAPQTELRFLLGPTPDAAYATEMQYFYYPETIVTAGSTWLGDNFDPVLLYGTLVEAYTFLKGEADMMAKYDQMYRDALVMAMRLGNGLERSDVYRSGQVRQKVA
jgi:hypothetical protein